MNKLSPIVSKFETEEEPEAYDRWFRAKVEATMADTRPPAGPHPTGPIHWSSWMTLPSGSAICVVSTQGASLGSS